MNKEKEFYIGWMDDMPLGYKQFIKRFLIAILVLLPLLAGVLVYVQKPFNSYIFEFGKTTTITGVYHHSPYPMLIADQGQLADTLSPEILLVGYGKFGAEGTIDQIQELNGTIDGRHITMQGSLIYGDGKTLLELTKGEDSFIDFVDNMESSYSILEPLKSKSLLKGEIIDPKCYFGVMKPAEGKIHKSCAIRCISGGIPPVFRVNGKDVNANTKYVYYLMLSNSGGNLSEAMLQKVGEEITLSGYENTHGSWNIFYYDEQ